MTFYVWITIIAASYFFGDMKLVVFSGLLANLSYLRRIEERL